MSRKTANSSTYIKYIQTNENKGSPTKSNSKPPFAWNIKISKPRDWFPQAFKIENQTKKYLRCFLASFCQCNSLSTKSVRFSYSDAQTQHQRIIY